MLYLLTVRNSYDIVLGNLCNLRAEVNLPVLQIMWMERFIRRKTHSTCEEVRSDDDTSSFNCCRFYSRYQSVAETSSKAQPRLARTVKRKTLHIWSSLTLAQLITVTSFSFLTPPIVYLRYACKCARITYKQLCTTTRPCDRMSYILMLSSIWTS